MPISCSIHLIFKHLENTCYRLLCRFHVTIQTQASDRLSIMALTTKNSFVLLTESQFFEHTLYICAAKNFKNIAV